ncbi:hypothetical protein ABFP60_00070 [Clostridioides difficile]
MGLFGIFSKNKGKVLCSIPEYYSETSELIDDISDLAERYSVDEKFLNTYSNEKVDIEYLNNARAEIESVLSNLGKNIEEYYNEEYTTVNDTAKRDENFSYSLDALVVIFNNSLDLYSDNEELRDELNTSYDKCNKELLKVKEILSDDETLQKFTGLKPIEKVEEPIIEEVSEITTKEELIINIDEVIESESNNDDYVDGDLIVNTEKMRIYFIRISRNEEDEINLNLCIENKLSKDVVIKVKEVTVDGVSTEPRFDCNVPSESRVYDKMIFKNEISQLVNLEGTFYIVNDNNEVIDEAKVSMFKED